MCPPRGEHTASSSAGPEAASLGTKVICWVLTKKRKKKRSCPGRAVTRRAPCTSEPLPGAIQPHSGAVRAAPIPLHGTHCSVDDTRRPEALKTTNTAWRRAAHGLREKRSFYLFFVAPITVGVCPQHQDPSTKLHAPSLCHLSAFLQCQKAQRMQGEVEWDTVWRTEQQQTQLCC